MEIKADAKYHNHGSYKKVCSHKMDYCKKCDVAFCKICNKEWKNTYQSPTTTRSSYIYWS